MVSRPPVPLGQPSPFSSRRLGVSSLVIALMLWTAPPLSRVAHGFECDRPDALITYLANAEANATYGDIVACGPSIISPLIAVLETETTPEHRTIGNRASRALAQFGPGAILPLLGVAQASPNQTARLIALHTLLDLGEAVSFEQSTFPGHPQALTDEQRLSLLTTLAEGLSHMANTDDNPRIREDALRALAGLRYVSEEVRAQILAVGVAQLQHPDQHVRVWSAFLLGDTFGGADPDPDTVAAIAPALIEVLRFDPEHRPRSAAASVLGWIRAEAAVPALLIAFEQEDVPSAGIALSHIATPEARAVIPLLVERFHQEGSLSWANALVRIEADSVAAIPALLEVLATPLSENRLVAMGFRVQAAQVLAAIGINADVTTALALRRELMWMGALHGETPVRDAARSAYNQIEQGNPALTPEQLAPEPRHILQLASPVSAPVGDSRPIRAIATVEGAPHAVSVDDQGQVQLWQLDTGRLLGEFTLPIPDGQAVALSPDLEFLATAGAHSTIDIWHLASQTQVHSFQIGTPSPQVASLAFSTDGSRLIGVIVNGDGLSVLLSWALPAISPNSLATE